MILIRGDGNARIGAGHLMRCMTIAEELARLQGGREKICFICADEDSGALARENGFMSLVLGTDYRDMESELPLWEKIWTKLRCEEAFCGHYGMEESTSCGGASDKVCDSGKQEPGYACASREAGSSDSCPLVLVDSYYVTDSYLAALRESAYTVLMDDMGVHRYPVDCVINYNAPASLEEYQKLYEGSGTKLLIGSRYTPLRRQFRRAEEIQGNEPGLLSGSYMSFRQVEETDEEKTQESFGSEGIHIGSAETDKGSAETDTGNAGKMERNAVREVLITTGGGDLGNIAEKILKRIYNDSFTFHLVTGRFHPGFQRMMELEKIYNNIHIHHDVKDMAGLMRRCQIALTAGGSTVYELAALGVPFICFSCAENQEALVNDIGNREIAGSAGAWHKEQEQTLERIGKLFEELAEKPQMREAYRSREMEVIDGEGAERLAEAILQFKNICRRRHV